MKVILILFRGEEYELSYTYHLFGNSGECLPKFDKDGGRVLDYNKWGHEDRKWTMALENI